MLLNTTDPTLFTGNENLLRFVGSILYRMCSGDVLFQWPPGGDATPGSFAGEIQELLK
jgi:hypothetical protein